MMNGFNVLYSDSWLSTTLSSYCVHAVNSAVVQNNATIMNVQACICMVRTAAMKVMIRLWNSIAVVVGLLVDGMDLAANIVILLLSETEMVKNTHQKYTFSVKNSVET